MAVAWEWRVRRVSDAEQLEQHSNLNVVGEVARVRGRARNALRTKRGRTTRSATLFEESVDALRTSLILGEVDEGIQIFAITSASSGEGKTSVAAQLAVSVAQSTGEMTLLIDGDMRSPDVHRLSSGALEPGLSNVLSDDCQLTDAVQTSHCETLHLLSAGKLFKSPHTLLGNKRLEALLEESRRRYRYIIIDTPPVLAASEAMVLAKHADITLLCARQDVSRIRQVKKVHERLIAAQVRPAGIILNDVPPAAYTSSHGHYGYRLQ